ncbi:multidrug resistance protein Atm1, partial [Trichinella spiralis]|uniref:multidrug resistance protein Atm1 n=1 Tax=Trichinella spiralis TaxID=6334 RepID=UPI0001EFDAD0
KHNSGVVSYIYHIGILLTLSFFLLFTILIDTWNSASFLNLTMSDNVGNNWTGGVQEEVSNEQQMSEQCKQANVLQGEDTQPSNDGVSAPAKKREKNEE